MFVVGAVAMLAASVAWTVVFLFLHIIIDDHFLPGIRFGDIAAAAVTVMAATDAATTAAASGSLLETRWTPPKHF